MKNLKLEQVKHLLEIIIHYKIIELETNIKVLLIWNMKKIFQLESLTYLQI